jgi:hypothetical protein
LSVDLAIKTVKVLEEAGRPASIEYVARQLGIAWGTARAILLQLALEEKIIAERTTTSWVFASRNSSRLEGLKQGARAGGQS